MLSINDLKKDVIFIHENAPCLVIAAKHKKMARQGATCDVKFKNLITGSIITSTFFPSQKIQEGEVEKREATFLYSDKSDRYFFCDPTNRSDRFFLEKEKISDQQKYLVQNIQVTSIYYRDQIIGIDLPIKIDAKVIEAPPNIKGNSSSTPTKPVVIETGATIQAPIFIQVGDIIRVNTQSGEYTERIKK